MIFDEVFLLNIKPNGSSSNVDEVA